jgi:hypothetical protein
MKKFVVYVIVITSLILLFGVAFTASTEKQDVSVPSEAIAAARQGMDIFVNKVADDPRKWGLEIASEVEHVVLGEGYRIAYIGRSAFTASSATSLIALEDTSLYPTFMFTIDLDGSPKSFVKVCRIGGGEYQFADFGGDATYFGIAREAFRKVAGDSIAPILMQYNGQYFMVLEKDGNESVLPVPFDTATAAIVASGQGFVETSVVIESIKAENSESEEGMSGGSSLDVWKNGSRQVTDSTPCMIALAVMGGICIIAYLAGLVVTTVRNSRNRKHSRQIKNM